MAYPNKNIFDRYICQHDSENDFLSSYGSSVFNEVRKFPKMSDIRSQSGYEASSSSNAFSFRSSISDNNDALKNRCRLICEDCSQKKLFKSIPVLNKSSTSKTKKFPLHQTFFANKQGKVTRRYRKGCTLFNFLAPFTRYVTGSLNEIASKTFTYLKQYINCGISNDSDSERY